MQNGLWYHNNKYHELTKGSHMNSDKTMRLASASMFFTGICATGAGVVLPRLIAQYGFSYDFSGLLLALLSAGNLLAALLCAALPQRLGMRRTALLLTSGFCLGYLLLGTLGAACAAGLGFFLVGVGKGSGLNCATVAGGSGGGDRTAKLSLLNAAFAAGALCVPVVLFAADGLPLWQTPLFVLAAAGGIVWLLFSRLYRTDQKSEKSAGETAGFLKQRRFWYATAFLFGQQCTEISVTGWLVTYFQDQGILRGTYSTFVVTVIWLAMMTGRLLLTFVLPETSGFRSLFRMSAATLLCYALLLCAQTGPLALLFLFLFGLSISGAYPTAIAQSNRDLSHASVGILLPVASTGAILMPYLIGVVAQRFGLRAGMACPLASIAIMAVFAVLLQREN